MSKLTLDALKQRADATASDELLGQISGGLTNDCHPEETPWKDLAVAVGTWLFETAEP